MIKNVKESLVELVMGDAILELLEADAPISHEALIAQLARNLEQEPRESRREAILAAIKEVQESIKLVDHTGDKGTGWNQQTVKNSKLLKMNSVSPGIGDKKH
ncbi:hypothetical protein [Citrobacter sp. BDA59-3]|uniref:hypothetical protein n=1 Tax=Citrobacter sp. BDA59-3 TaxID=2781952 RepID=UPI0018812091|nr:hypothetical protein [Citrobacter sp. BDA59-3]QOV68588.1 hypothetical protein IP582_23765 [Citrobacter sp. BDA59-3]